MVATLARLRNPAAAVNYYENDDYYVADAKAPSQWHGRGAARLGLHGEVDPDAFSATLHGKLPDGTVLGTIRDGVRKHKPGWDLTFSAPKSVSVMALVAGDRRLIEAHNRAAMTTLDHVERHAAVTRIREKGVKHAPRIATDALVVATFPHFTARATEALPDPQLHTHSVIMNATQSDDRIWRSVESHPFYKMQKGFGAIYHQELAFEVQRLGYSVTIDAEGLFEIDAVPLDVRKAFSSRSDDIEVALRERGQTRATATAAEKAVVALDTRSPKETVDPRKLAVSWHVRADVLGFGKDVRRTLVAEAEAHAATRKTLNTRQRMRVADQKVAYALRHIGEQDAVFSAAVLERVAGDAARAQATNSDIVAAIDRAERAQNLVIRAAPGMARGAVGYTTREAIAIEQRMLGLEFRGRVAFAPLYDDDDTRRAIVAHAEVAAARRRHKWNDGQREATKGLLSSRASLTGIQGSAGSAKTTTVLSVYADAARACGLTVRALAPTRNAADELGRAIRAKPMTVARLLVGDGDDIAQRREVWIVDEASMLSARDAEQVLARAHDAEARVVLVGDVKQLGSVQAGRAFGQLQDSGMPTFKLAEIVRQTNTKTREAVESLVAGDIEAAFTALDEGGGEIVEHDDDDVRRARLARDFARLSPRDRARTLVLDPTRAGRQHLTDAIRAELRRDGTLGDQAMTASVLDAIHLTDAQRTRAASYRPGSIVLFRADDDTNGLRRDIGYRVDAINPSANTLRLLDSANQAITWNPGQSGADQAEAYAEMACEFRTGDRIQFTRNDPATRRVNGRTATVVAIDPATASIVVANKKGKRQTLDTNRLADRHIRPGWVQTIHAAQGATSDRVMAHLESFRSNVDARIAYVAVSRAKTFAAIYTDDRLALVDAIEGRDGAKVGAIDEMLLRDARVGIGITSSIGSGIGL